MFQWVVYKTKLFWHESCPLGKVMLIDGVVFFLGLCLFANLISSDGSFSFWYVVGGIPLLVLSCSPFFFEELIWEQAVFLPFFGVILLTTVYSWDNILSAIIIAIVGLVVLVDVLLNTARWFERMFLKIFPCFIHDE